MLAIALMVFDKRAAGTAQLRAALSMPLAPLQYIVSSPIEMFDKLSNIASTHDALVKENLDLKSEHLLLKAQVQRLLAIESENNQLKSLLSTSTKIQGKVLIAQILAVDSDPFVNQVTLDKGSHDSVFVGQPVLDSNGVMGQIIQVGPLTSRVLLVNDPHSGVPVQNARNGVRAIAVGDSYSGKLHLLNVQQTADIKQGDTLVTSGLGEHYPEGYPIGKVAIVVKDPGLQFATITVEPSAHLDRSREVLLVWPAKEAFVKLDTVVATVAPADVSAVSDTKDKNKDKSKDIKDKNKEKVKDTSNKDASNKDTSKKDTDTTKSINNKDIKNQDTNNKDKDAINKDKLND